MKQLLRVFSRLLPLIVAAQMAFSWGNATHTHFAKELGVQFGPQNANEMYGAVLVDAFNLVLTVPGQTMYQLSHQYPEAMVAAARHCDARAAAFGFASHNDAWGADYTAHHYARTLPDTGYAVLKGQQLAPALIPVLVQIILNGSNPNIPEPVAQLLAANLAPELGHDLSETAVDLMVKRREDPCIGARMVFAAQARSREAPLLLCNAYAQLLADNAGIAID